MPPSSATTSKFNQVAEAAARYGEGIDPDLLATIALHESGLSGPAHFGIKGGSGPEQATWEEVGGKRVNTTARFRSYPTADAAVVDFIDLISTSPRYAKAWAVRSDPAKFVTELQKAGYATDSAWPQKIMGFKDNLAKQGMSYDGDGSDSGVRIMAGNQAADQTPSAIDEQTARDKAEVERTYKELQDFLSPENSGRWWEQHDKEIKAKAKEDAGGLLSKTDLDKLDRGEESKSYLTAGQQLYDEEKKRLSAAYDQARGNYKPPANEKPKPTVNEAAAAQGAGTATADDLDVLYKNAQLATSALSAKTSALNAEVANGRLTLDQATAQYNQLHDSAKDAQSRYENALTRYQTQRQNEQTNARELGKEARTTYEGLRKGVVPLAQAQLMHSAINKFGASFVPGYEDTSFTPVGLTTDQEMQDRARQMTMDNASAFSNFGSTPEDDIVKRAISDGIAAASQQAQQGQQALSRFQMPSFTAGAA